MISIISMIEKAIPDLSSFFLEDIGHIPAPRFMVGGDIDHWGELYSQINAVTGRTNSYRDIRRICEAEKRVVPSLGTLRNYLGSGGIARRAEAVSEWRVWFEDFGRLSQFYRDEHKDRTTKEQWETFRTLYESFMGY